MEAIIISSISLLVALLAFYHNFYKRKVECFVLANGANAYKEVISSDFKMVTEDRVSIDFCFSNLGNTPLLVKDVSAIASNKNEKNRFLFSNSKSQGIKAGEIENYEFVLEIPRNDVFSTEMIDDKWVDIEFELTVVNYIGMYKTIRIGILRVYAVNHETFTTGGFCPEKAQKISSSGFKKTEAVKSKDMIDMTWGK